MLTLLALTLSVLHAQAAPWGSCTRWIDNQEIPHLKAESINPAMACLGYQHGLDRAWQMEFFRMTLQGRVAEWVGYRGVRSDVMVRLLDLRARARRLTSELDSDHRRTLEAYAEGASRGMREAWATVPEFQTGLFTHEREPEAWKPEDTVGIFLLQALSQTQRSFTHDLEEETWKKEQGALADAFFSPNGVPWDTWIMPVPAPAAPPAETSVPNRGLPSGVAQTELREWAMHRGWEGTGSNNWVVAPSNSATGKAWMLNDPHLDLKTPPFWYWVNFRAGNADVMGASLPGTPIVASGLNRQVAWGLTNAYMDTGDVLEVPRARLGKTQSLRPTLWFRWWKFQIPIFWKTFERTAEGLPILPIETGNDSAYVVRWSGLHLRGSQLDPLFKVWEAGSAREVDRILGDLGLPSWNYVFADVEGNIGYRTMGLLPRRFRKPDFGVQKIADAEPIDFTEFLSADEQPHALNPERGWIVTANNRQWPADAGPKGLYDGHAHYLSMRAFRISELLGKTAKHDQASLQAVQCDVQAVDARFFVPKLIERLKDNSDPMVQAVLPLLREWDWQAGPDCRVCVIFRRWMNYAIEVPNLDERAFWRALQMNEADAPAWAKSFELVAALRAALKDLGIATPEGVAAIAPWRDWLRIAFDHMSGLSELSSKHLPGIGDEHTVTPGVADWEERQGKFRFWHRVGASQRLMVQLTNPPTVRAILAGSNRRVGPNAVTESEQDPWKKWTTCQYDQRVYPVDWMSSEVSAASEILQF